METWGIGAVINYGGWTLALLSVVLWCIAAGTLGHFLARWVEKNPKSSRRVSSATMLLTLFAFGFWLYTFGWSYRYDISSWVWNAMVILIIAGLSFFFRYMIVGNGEGCGFLEKEPKEKRALFWFFSIAGFLVMSLFIAANVSHLPWASLDQRASYYYDLALKKTDYRDSDIREAMIRIERYGYELPLLSKAVLYLKLRDKEHTMRYFREHAENQDGNERKLWLGISAIYGHSFELGAQRFERAGENKLAIMALFLGDVLSKEKFKELSVKITNKIAPSAIVSEIGEVVSLSPVSPQKTDIEKLIARIDQLERNLIAKKVDKKKRKK